jgi:arylsulfatase
MVAIWRMASWAPLATASEFPARPNIVLVVTDDQGYGDLGCHGNTIIHTPNIDRFHDESVRFTDFHVSPTCAPTRSVLMTGRHEFRNGVTHTIYERERMTLRATTLAQVLRTAGYTTGVFGKWHLGDEPAYQPDQRGFDEVFIHGGGGIGQTYPGSCGDAPGNTYFNPAIKHNGRFDKTRGYCTDVFFGQALNWIGEKRGKSAPFFVYLTPNAPHEPLQCPVEYEKLYSGRVPTNIAKYYGMISNIDDNFGKLLASLKEWGLERDTLVIFMSDNGAWTSASFYNEGMRGSKVTPYMGGTRVPCFWRWPGVLPSGVDASQLTAHLDIFPTLAELAGASLSPETVAQVEGRSLAPLLKNPRAPWADRTLITHVGRWPRGQAAKSEYAQCSVRNARYQLVNATSQGEKWELFDILADPGETTSIIAQHPDVVGELRASLDKWWAEVLPCLVNEEAFGPKINPFKEEYWKQFGGGPDAALLKAMDPSRVK